MSLKATPHIHALDGLRGVAALAVLFFHLCLVFPAGYLHYSGDPVPADATGADVLFALLRTPLAVLAAGRPAVFVFFVLSGFVLAESLCRPGRSSYPAYLAKRFARIWLPFAAAVGMSTIFYGLAHDNDSQQVSTWFTDYSWQAEPSLAYVADHLVMSGDSDGLLNVAWSLVVELRVSIVFPLLLLAFNRMPRATVAGTFLLSLACVVAGPRLEDPVIESFAETGRYLYLFVAGIALARHRVLLMRAVNGLSPSRAALLWAAAINLVLFRMYTPTLEGRWIWLLGDVPVAIGAIAVVALCLRRGRTHRALTHRGTLALGRWSYSLYLVHLPIILAVVHLGTPGLPLLPLAAISLVLSLLAATLFHRIVEAPSGRLGRIAADGLDARLGSSAAPRATG